MRKSLLLAATLASFGAAGAWAQSGEDLRTLTSAHEFTATLSRLDAAIKAGGMKVFAHIDHASAAKEFGATMPPATVVIFGNPKGGTPNFLKQPTLAIDLPLKFLVWQDASGKTFLTYNTGAYVFGAIFKRHGLNLPEAAIAGQEKLLDGLAQKTVK